MSLNGVLFTSTQCLPAGNSVHVTLLLNGGSDDQRIEAEGHVVRVVEEDVAIEFDNICAGSVEHLKRLVLYNAEDTDKVDGKFESHIGIRGKG